MDDLTKDDVVKLVVEARHHLTEAKIHLIEAQAALRQAEAREAELAVSYVLPWVVNARRKAREAMPRI